MQDCHANLFVGLTAPKRFPAFVQHAATPSIPSQFSSRVEPRLRGMAIFSEMICERCSNHVGKDLREIQELLRHKNIRTTVRYTHVGYEQTRQTAEALSQALE
jgi:hypothetical protein